MVLDEFLKSLDDPHPPSGYAAPLRALWYAHRREWDTAHSIVQEEEDAESALVHAYIHRQEGDLPNARYWYNRARRTPFSGTLEAEWEALAHELTRGKSTRARD